MEHFSVFIWDEVQYTVVQNTLLFKWGVFFFLRLFPMHYLIKINISVKGCNYKTAFCNGNIFHG